MSETLRIEIDVDRALAILRELSPSSMQAAWRRTLRKTSVWIKGQTAKAVSKETKIPQKFLRKRVYFFLKSYDTGKVWLGLNAVDAKELGNPRQTRAGVTTGRHQFKSAWIYNSKWAGKHKTVRIRHRDGTIENRSYTTSDLNSGLVMRRTGKARLPYERVKYDWADAGEAAFRNIAVLAEQRLLTILEQEVNYEIQKAIGNAK